MYEAKLGYRSIPHCMAAAVHSPIKLQWVKEMSWCICMFREAAAPKNTYCTIYTKCIYHTPVHPVVSLCVFLKIVSLCVFREVTTYKITDFIIYGKCIQLSLHDSCRSPTLPTAAISKWTDWLVHMNFKK